MTSQLSIRSSCLGAMLVTMLVSACGKEDDTAVKGRTGPNGTARDSVSDLALGEDGLGQLQVGMTVTEAVNMGAREREAGYEACVRFRFPRGRRRYSIRSERDGGKGKDRAHRC